MPKIYRERVAMVAILIILVSLLSGFSGAKLENHANDTKSNNLAAERQIVTSQSQLISQIAKTVGPSVVSVTVSIAGSPSNESEFFGFSTPRSVQAAGTGIIISSDGVIMTNRHVVPASTDRVSVTLSDGTQLKDVSVLGRTGEHDSLDIAFLKINDSKGHKLKAATLGNSSNIQVGDNVVAIGNALGQFQNTVTSGIISGFGRSVQAGSSSNDGSAENLDDLLQTDAAINEGNSGGPLVNLNGQVVGINTAIAGGAQNIGFAIPVNDVRGLVTQVLKSGKFARPYLGVRYVVLTPDIANEFDLKAEKGAYIPPETDPSNPSLVPDGPAAKAGLQERDVITAVDNTKIDQTHSLVSLLSQHQPDDKVKLTVLRGDKTIQITVTLGELPANQS